MAQTRTQVIGHLYVDQRDKKPVRYTRGSIICRCSMCGHRKVCVRERVAKMLTLPMCRSCREQ